MLIITTPLISPVVEAVYAIISPVPVQIGIGFTRIPDIIGRIVNSVVVVIDEGHVGLSRIIYPVSIQIAIPLLEPVNIGTIILSIKIKIVIMRRSGCCDEHINSFVMTYDSEGEPVYTPIETFVEVVWET